MSTAVTSAPRIAMVEVQSSQIHSIGHDPNTSTLAIRFKNYKGEATSLYHYSNVTAADFEAFRSADSIGSHFGKHIKPRADKYPFQRVDESA